MDDLRQRFATLDSVPVPDVWSDVERRLEALGTRASTGRLAVVKPAWRGAAAKDGTPLGSAKKLNTRRSIGLLAAAALITALLVGGALAVGSGLIRLTSVVPPSPDLSTAPAPTSTVPSPTTRLALGGRVILVHDYKGPSDRGAHDVFALDAGTGEKTRLGTLPGANVTGERRPYTFQRDADGKHVLILGGVAGVADLEAPTDASRPFGFLATGDIASGDRGEYLLSPRGDRIVAVHTTDVASEVVVLDLGGSVLQAFSLPVGKNRLDVVSWSPDESALLATGCRPCNKAEIPSERQTADHGHLYIVPVDGSPWRELLDEDNGAIGAAWSPDGSTLAVTRYACPPGQPMPRCGGRPGPKTTLSFLAVGDNTEKSVSMGTEWSQVPVWSPDGQRIAYVGGTLGDTLEGGGIFVVNADGSGAMKLADTSAPIRPVWSPDGQWLLYQKDWLSTDWWIVSPDGGKPRLLGPYGGVAW